MQGNNMAKAHTARPDATDNMRDAQGQQGYATLKDVLAHLRDGLGLKASMALLKKRSRMGMLAKGADGLWSRDAVDALAQTLPKAGPEAGGASDAGGLAQEKLREEIRKLRAQTAGIEHENQRRAGQYLTKAQVWLEMASRASALYAVLSEGLRGAVPGIVRAAADAGPERAEEAALQALDRALAETVNQLSEPRTWTVDFSAALGPDEGPSGREGKGGRPWASTI